MCANTTQFIVSIGKLKGKLKVTVCRPANTQQHKIKSLVVVVVVVSVISTVSTLNPDPDIDYVDAQFGNFIT